MRRESPHLKHTSLRNTSWAQLAAPLLALLMTSIVWGQSETASRVGFENPPLLYAGETLGGSFFPNRPVNFDDPALRMAQRTTETPVRLPRDDDYGSQEFFSPPSDTDEVTFSGPKLSAYKNGFFQKLSFSETWVDRGGPSTYGIHEMEMFVTVALPAPTTDFPMLITPYMNMRLLDGPRNPDLPARLYETYVDFMWVPKITERLVGIVAVAPSEYSDFKAEGFRMTGKGLLRFDIVPNELQLLAGVLYLNREDIRLLPAGGLTWTPNPDMKYEIIFPRPKFAHRIAFSDDYEDWLYLAGEFGGNSFAIKRATGLEDTVTLRDWRIMLGLERKLNGGAGFRLEIGYVFSRSIEYASGTPDANPASTALIRLGITF